MSAIAEHAAGFVGLEETPRGSNRSPLIDDWNERVGDDLGSPWCAAFAWCMGQDVYGSRWETKRTGSVQELYSWAVANGRILADPVPDALMCVYHTDLNRYAHVGIVEDVKADGSFSTIEGNTNADGSREGYAVCRHLHVPGPKLAFVAPQIAPEPPTGDTQ